MRHCNRTPSDDPRRARRASRRRRRRLALFVFTAGIAGEAVRRELALPADQRSWHGRVFGVPYDFRAPTVDRVRGRVWDPTGPLLNPRAFGVGWDLNFGRLVALARRDSAAPDAAESANDQ
jgi:hypothetical protein